MDWRQSLCGTVALRSALEGGQPGLDLNALRDMSDAMSCGGMHVPNWQSRFLGTETALQEPKMRLLNLAVQDKDKSSVLVISSGSQANAASDRSPPISDPRLAIPANAEAVIQEIGEWWNKN